MKLLSYCFTLAALILVSPAFAAHQDSKQVSVDKQKTTIMQFAKGQYYKSPDKIYKKC